MERGKLASEFNHGGYNARKVAHPYRGSDWERPKDVPDEHAVMGDIPPKSVTETSKSL